MQLIVEYDIKVRMKTPGPAGCAGKTPPRRKRWHSDAIITHRPNAGTQPPVTGRDNNGTTGPCVTEQQKQSKLQQAARLKHPHPEAPVTAKAEAPGPTDRNNQPPRRQRQKKPCQRQPQQPDTPEEEPPGKLQPR